MAKLRVGINGFGRIGRVLFRAGFESSTSSASILWTAWKAMLTY